MFSMVLMLVTNTAVTYTWYGLGAGLWVVVLEVALNGLFLYACLSIRQRRERFEQSLTAVCGISAVMALVAWPWALEVGANPQQVPIWVAWGQLLLMMWSLTIWARVLRLSCEVDPIIAAAWSLGFFFISAVVLALTTPAIS